MRGLFSQINKPQCLKGKNQVAFCVASPSWKGLTSERTNTKQCWVFFFKTVLLSFQLLKVQSPHFDFPHQFSLTCLCSKRPASSANISLPVGKGGAGRPDRVSKPCWPCWLQESYWDPKFRFLWHRTDSSTWMTHASPESSECGGHALPRRLLSVFSFPIEPSVRILYNRKWPGAPRRALHNLMVSVF